MVFLKLCLVGYLENVTSDRKLMEHCGMRLDILYFIGYDREADHYVCPKGKVIPFTKVFNDYRTGTRKKEYRAGKHVCTGCPIRRQCLGKSAQEKKFSVTYYREEYERNNHRVDSPLGHYLKGKRQSTVEPVFGTLTQFMGLGKVNTIGLSQANKCMQMAAMAYNLKKYLKFIEKRSKSGAGALDFLKWAEKVLQKLVSSPLASQNSSCNPTIKNQWAP